MFRFRQIWMLTCVVLFVALGSAPILAQDFDPFSPTAPLEKAEKEFQRLKAERDGLDWKDNRRDALDKFLPSLRDHLKTRGSKFNENGNLIGATSGNPNRRVSKLDNTEEKFLGQIQKINAHLAGKYRNNFQHHSILRDLRIKRLAYQQLPHLLL